MTRTGVACRSCAADDLDPILSLGTLPLANALLNTPQAGPNEEFFPLDLVRCPRCSLVQIAETVPPHKLFREYSYFSSYSDTTVQAAGALAQRLCATRRLSDDDLVVEVGSNDGYLLQHYRRHGIPVLGIEPAANIATIAESERKIPTLCAFFGRELAATLHDEGRRASVLHAHNVLAHIADLNGCVAGMATLLADDGVAVIEVPYVRDMIDRVEFDTIYHEHLCYFSVSALRALAGRHGLDLQDVERLSIHGGSLRVFLARSDAGAPAEAVMALCEEERAAGIDRADYYAHFAARVREVKTRLLQLLREIRAGGKSIAAYGAAAKGTVLLNYCGIDTTLVDFVADRSPHKQGRFVPGVRVPIEDPAQLLARRPDYVLLLAWNIADEILAQQAAYLEQGGKFIVPIPEPRVLESPPIV